MHRPLRNPQMLRDGQRPSSPVRRRAAGWRGRSDPGDCPHRAARTAWPESRCPNASASSAPSWSVRTRAGSGRSIARCGVNWQAKALSAAPQPARPSIRCPMRRSGSVIHEFDPGDRQLQRQRVRGHRKIEFIAAPRVQQHEIGGLQARRVAVLHDRPVVVGLAKQVVEVRRAAREAGFPAVDMLRRALDAIDADGVELPALDRAVEARPNRRRDIHLEKAFADGADPVVQTPFRLDQTGRPLLDHCRRPGRHGSDLPQFHATIFSSSAISASGAVTFGAWLASISK